MALLEWYILHGVIDHFCWMLTHVVSDDHIPKSVVKIKINSHTSGEPYTWKKLDKYYMTMEGY